MAKKSKKPAWWSEAKHGKDAMLERQRLRLAGRLNRPIRSYYGPNRLAYIANEVCKREGSSLKDRIEWFKGLRLFK